MRSQIAGFQIMCDGISRRRGMQIEISKGDETALAFGAILWETPFQVINYYFNSRGFSHAKTWFDCFVASLAPRASIFCLEIASASQLGSSFARNRLGQ